MGREGRYERGAAGLTTDRCFACGGEYAPAAGATHPYMLSSPGCWAAYGRLLAREYESPALFAAAHRLTVDAYALQHPGDPGDRRARQSVWVHYAGLHLALVENWSFAAIAPVMRRLAHTEPPALPLAPTGFAVTLADVLARPEPDHVDAVRGWAGEALAAWHTLAPAMAALLRPA